METRSKKRTSDTEIIHKKPTPESSVDAKPAAKGGKNMESSSAAATTSKSKLRVRIKRFHGVARWTWNAGSDDEVCGICQSAFEGVAPGIKYPGDECPVVFGKCGHAFHLQCVATWLNSSRQTCPVSLFTFRLLERLHLVSL